MKKIFTTLFFALLINFAQAQYRKILSVLQFDNLENTVKSGYGSREYPIESGAFINLADQKSRGEKMRRLFNSYRWPNGNKIDFSKRHSTQGAGSKGIVDVYALVNPETSDTIRLHVDPYKAAEKYFVPKGLTALTAATLKTEIEPILEQIQEINNAEDGAALKLHAAGILTYLTQNFDQSLLVDQDRLRFLLEDKETDKSLAGFLMRSYIFNKFYALAKDIDNEKNYAFEQMKTNYNKYIQVHPEAEIGKLAEVLK